MKHYGMTDTHDFQIIELEEVDSTNNFLREHSSSLPCRITLATAEYQTAGRGATGGWESEEGQNLVFSLLIHPVMVPAPAMFVLSEALALAISSVLEHYCAGIQIKWPNDIYCGDRKMVGMLIENDLLGKTVKNSVMGVGVNVNQTLFTSDAPNPCSLAQVLGYSVNRTEVLKNIVEAFSAYYNKVERGAYDDIHQEYIGKLYRKGEWCAYSDDDGDFKAILRTVEPDGHLVLEDETGTKRRYAFKEVKFL